MQCAFRERLITRRDGRPPASCLAHRPAGLQPDRVDRCRIQAFSRAGPRAIPVDFGQHRSTIRSAHRREDPVQVKHQASDAFEASLFDVLRTAFRITLREPRFAIHAMRLLGRQRRAARLRDRLEEAGTHVPPFLIHSITDRCNLDCSGCYAKLLHHSDRPELSDDRVRGILGEARDLGVSVILIAGGEPLLRENLLAFTAAFPEILFLLFTNGSLVDGAVVEQLREQRHVVPVLSIEGGEDQTDERRGGGTYQYVTDAMVRLSRRRVFFGTSTTLTRENFELATSQAHLRDLMRRGCRLFYYINYVPVKPGTDGMQLEPDQVRDLEERLARYRRSLPALFIAFPHDEVALGGCLAAGRGFLHINAYGDVEPCPFSPHSDTNLNEASLQDALASPLLQRILNSGVVLDETDGRCALWKQREWVAGLLSEGPRGVAHGASPRRIPAEGESVQATGASSHRFLVGDKKARTSRDD
jgi:MoaA/NifB/PqqE/SkfB family radical SAM enzyme